MARFTSAYSTLYQTMPSPVRFSEVTRMRNRKGYVLNRCSGSHYQFVKPGVGTFTVPVHHNLVKVIYVKKIEKLP